MANGSLLLEISMAHTDKEQTPYLNNIQNITKKGLNYLNSTSEITSDERRYPGYQFTSFLSYQLSYVEKLIHFRSKMS